MSGASRILLLENNAATMARIVKWFVEVGEYRNYVLGYINGTYGKGFGTFSDSI